MSRLAFVNDLHLDHNSNDYALRDFVSLMRKGSPDGLLVAGDIADALSVSRHLELLNRVFDFNIYFVLGNHDFYGGFIDEVKERVSRVANSLDGLFYLDDLKHVELSKDTVLVGCDGWADGRLGDYLESRVSDYFYIKDFFGLGRKERFRKLNELGDMAAVKLKDRLEGVVEKYKNILCLTHVPPFDKVCLYNGRPTEKKYLPHFSCKAVGDVLMDVAKENRDSCFRVFCGHTHHESRVRVLDNLEVEVGGGGYDGIVARWVDYR